MHRLRRFLVGLDFEEGGGLTPGSRAAAAQALRLARHSGAAVDFLHSVFHDDEARRDLPVEEPTVRGATASLATDGVETATWITDERPYVAMIRRVVEGRNDLVVVAKRDTSRSDDRRLGSISMKLLRQCPGAVWVVRPGHRLEHRAILAATDLTPVGDRATEYGAYLATLEGCELDVVHAWQVPMELQLAAARIGEEETARRRQAIEAAALAHVRGVPAVAELGERAHVYLRCGRPSDTILGLAEQKDPDLVVMGTISRGGIAGMVVGNTAEKLLYRLEPSILAVKPDDFVCTLDLG